MNSNPKRKVKNELLVDKPLKCDISQNPEFSEYAEYPLN